MANYELEGVKWGAGGFGTAGGTVTWAYDASVPAFFASVLVRAFAEWSRYGNIQFSQVSSTSAAAIDVSLAPIDGPNATVGHAQYRFTGTRVVEGAVTFDSAEDWAVSGGTVRAKSGVDLFVVAVHEVGHVIGLGHYTGGPALMNPVLSPSITGPTESDIAGIRAIYGAPLPASGLIAVHRFYDRIGEHHFYTPDGAEKASIQASLPQFLYEGASWATPVKGAGTVDIFRFYDNRTGDHFYTASAAERDTIIATLPSYAFEGVAFQAYASKTADAQVTLQRFFNQNTGGHHFAGNEQEAANIRAGLSGAGWIDEGPGFTVHRPSADMIFV